MKKCNICNTEVNAKAPYFNFPRLPEWHEFSYLGGKKYHLDCIKKLDKELHFGKILADIASSKSIHPNFLGRNGNVIATAIIDETGVDIYDYEDFVEFNINIENIEKVKKLTVGEVIHNKATSIKLLDNGMIELLGISFKMKLTEFTYVRLLELLTNVDLTVFSYSPKIPVKPIE